MEDWHEDAGHQAGEDAPDEGPDDWHPAVRPVAPPFSRDGQHEVCDTGAEIARGVDGVSCRSAKRGADPDDQQGDRKGAQRGESCLQRGFANR